MFTEKLWTRRTDTPIGPVSIKVTVDYTKYSEGEAKFKIPIRTRGIRIVVHSVEKEDNEVNFSVDLLGVTVIKDDGSFGERCVIFCNH